MRISVNWVKDYVSIPELPVKELAEKITLGICEVEEFGLTGRHLEQVIAVEVKGWQKHPNADRLRLVDVYDGQEIRRIVCGAGNFDTGDTVALALIGAELPGGITIKKSKIRGEESSGMLCAEDELGFSDDHEGIMLLPGSVKPGTPLSEVYPDMLDCILEIDNKSLTHRPDLWGHYGFARECSVLFDTPLKPLFAAREELSGEGTNKINIVIHDNAKAKRFSALEITGLNIVPSRDVIRHRLYRVGSKAINNLVDVTNYVMLDCGQPMHAFDAAQIPENTLRVSLAKPGETLRTLQHKDVTFSADDVAIYDGAGPSAVAGVIGGERSGISDETAEMLLEAGCWNAALVRKTGSRMNIRTEAMQRYEKSLDPELTEQSIRKAWEILRQTNPNAAIRGTLFDYRLPAAPIKPIVLKQQQIERLLGTNVASATIIKLLTGLGFTLQTSGSEADLCYQVTVPSWRATKDISIPQDLIEEIGRMIGYNSIDERPPLFPVEKPVVNQPRRFERHTKEILASNGMQEIFTYPMNARSEEAALGLDSIIPNEILNPVSALWHQMRTTLFPGFLTAVKNARKMDTEFALFEIGKMYGKNAAGKRFEHNQLCMVFSSKRETAEVFNEAKRIVQRLFERLGIAVVWQPGDRAMGFEHRFYNAFVRTEHEHLGRVFSPNRQFMNQQELNHTAVFAEFDFEKMFAVSHVSKTSKMVALPKYPAMTFDISIMAKITEPFAAFADIIQSSDAKVESVNYVYEFHPPDMPGYKSLTVSISFRDPEATLSQEAAAKLRDKAVKTLEKAGYRLRS